MTNSTMRLMLDPTTLPRTPSAVKQLWFQKSRMARLFVCLSGDSGTWVGQGKSVFDQRAHLCCGVGIAD